MRHLANYQPKAALIALLENVLKLWLRSCHQKIELQVGAFQALNCSRMPFFRKEKGIFCPVPLPFKTKNDLKMVQKY